MAKKKAKKKAVKEQVILVIASKCKEYLAEKDMRCGGEVPAALSERVAQLLEDAAFRAQENKRGTVQAKDI